MPPNVTLSAAADNGDVRPAPSSAKSSTLIALFASPIRLIRIWTPKFGVHIEGMPPWLAFMCLAAVFVLVLVGAWP